MCDHSTPIPQLRKYATYWEVAARLVTMPPIPDAPRSQRLGSLIREEDLPEGWYLPDRYPGERDGEDISDTIDQVLGYDDWNNTEEHRQRQLESNVPETIDGRWRYIEHTPTHTRVMIRLQRQAWRTPPEVRITGVIHLPWRPGDSITSQQLRELPIARIEANVNKRLFDMERVATITGDRISLPSGRRIKECEIVEKITPDPKQNPDFYQFVALQHDWLARHGERNPSAEIARINEVPLSTAQGWLVKVRSLGLLPPGRRGRRGNA